MRVYTQPRSYDHERAFLAALGETLRSLGHETVDDHRLPHDAAVVWNGRGWRAEVPTLYAEMGWLPRWGFQLSHRGINAESHVAHEPVAGVPVERLRKVEQQLRALRSEPCAFHHFKTDVPATQKAPHRRFILAPLQVEQDTNMRHVPEALRTAEGFMARIAEWNPPLPVVFKAHPASLAKGQRKLTPARPQDMLAVPKDGNIHAWLKHPNCAAVVTLNSNCAHDAMIWDRPVVALGRGVWPERGPFANQLPEDWEAFEAWAGSEVVRQARLTYAHHLFWFQWSLEDARQRDRVAAALTQAVESFKRPTRKAASKGGRVNVYCRDLGWLFEDLKGWFQRIGGKAVTVSEHPEDSASAWVCLRTDEVVSVPDVTRAVLCYHDLMPHSAAYAMLPHLGGLVLTHPQQAAQLSVDRIALPGRVLLRPIGAPETFRPGRVLHEWMTVAWVGRDTGENKGLHAFVRAVGKAGGAVPLRVVLLGSQLERTAAELRKMGHSVDLLDRAVTAYADYPSLYAGFDAVLVTSVSEAGPLPLFEALASGVPVVSTPCGWAPMLLHDGYNGYVRDDAAGMAQCIQAIYQDRQAWAAKAPAISASLMGWRLEGWIRDVLDLAKAVA